MDIKKRIKAEPKKNFLVLYVIAGHGMNQNGKQIVMLNEFNKSGGFYKAWGAE